MDATKAQNVQNKLFQLDFRPDNMTTTTYIQLELYWHPVHLKFRVLLGFLWKLGVGTPPTRWGPL